MRWTAYPLHTSIPEEGISLEQTFARTNKDIEKMNARLKKAADDAGLPFGRRTMTYNSGLAHELGKWAETQGKGDEYHNAVFRTFFVDGRNIGSASVLVDLVKEIGLYGKEAEDIIETRSFKDAVDADWSRSLTIDPEYIPSLMIGEQLLVNPQQYELFEQFMIENNVRKRSTVSPRISSAIRPKRL